MYILTTTYRSFAILLIVCLPFLGKTQIETLHNGYVWSFTTRDGQKNQLTRNLTIEMVYQNKTQKQKN